MGKLKDLTGQHFGKLKVIEYLHQDINIICGDVNAIVGILLM